MNTKHFLRACIALCVLICTAPLLASSDPKVIAVLAYRSKEETHKTWQPFVDALNATITEEHFVLKACTLKELNLCVEQRKADFIITNPGHYALLKKRHNLPYPLATLIGKQNGQHLNAFGGVIFTRTEHATIQSLKDLKGKTIALTGDESLGGYQLQAYELYQTNLTFPEDLTPLPTGMPHDNVVDAVLSKKADVGFVRTGVLEEMEKEGMLNLSDIKIIHEQFYEGFPLKISTKRYPEWPLVSLPHTSQALARKVSSLALGMDENVFKEARVVHGFTIASDYSGVEEVLRTLRFPPFDTLPRFDIKEFIEYYKLELLLILSLISLLFLGGFTRVWVINRRMQESQKGFKALLEGSFSGLFIHHEGKILECNHFLCSLVGYTVEELKQGSISLLLDTKSTERLLQSLQEKDETVLELIGLSKDKRTFTVHVESKQIPFNKKEVYVTELRDISEEKKAQEKLFLAANVFTHAREAIVITQPNGTIIDVNQAFSFITGYSKEEALGKNISFLKSGRHESLFYQKMWNDLFSKGHWYGEIWNRRKNGETYVEMLTISAIKDERNIIKQFVAIFSDITTLKEHEHQLEHIAHHDALTNLPNRLLFSDRLHQAMLHAYRSGLLLVVAYVDLDGFKTINDQYGHAIGDKLLIALSELMKNSLREGDTLARIGGDEFVIVLQNLDTVNNAIPMLNRLLEAAATPVVCDDITLKVSASIGVSVYPQADDMEADQLLRQADQAMYQAKISGRNRYHIFDEKADRDIQGVHESLENIRQALERNEFVLYYQPKVNMRTAELEGVEALIRWMHPTRGLLAPAVFLPIIEDHPLAIAVGEWVIYTAVSQLHQWKKEGHILHVSVNVGARHLQSPHFTEFLAQTLARFPEIHPSQLECEILETSALHNTKTVTLLMNTCKDLGIHFSLDDFGTGYSSLSYLKQLPISTLKIDQSFIFDMLYDTNDLSILEGILGLASAFGHHVIAEGVETEEHGRMLLYMGCEKAQGYGIARPMPASDILTWKASWRPHASWQNTPSISHKNYPVLYSMVEHRGWVNLFEKYLKKECDFPPTLGGRHCYLGLWLENETSGMYDEMLLSSIKKEHNTIHELAQHLVHQTLSPAQKEAYVSELYTSRDSLIEKLRRLLVTKGEEK